MRRARAPKAPLAMVFAVLGLAPPQFNAKDYAEACELMAEWKVKILKPAFRHTAKACHPDRNPDDPAAEERFKAARAAYERLLDLKVRPPRPSISEQMRIEREAMIAALASLHEAHRSGVHLSRPMSRTSFDAGSPFRPTSGPTFMGFGGPVIIRVVNTSSSSGTPSSDFTDAMSYSSFVREFHKKP